MPAFILRRASVVVAYPNVFRVILRLADGFELDVGGISERVGIAGQTFWQWSAPGASGQAETREAAMDAFRAAWPAVTEDTLSRIRSDQEWTANKYALWDAGYNQLGKGPIKCRCGQMFNPGNHEETMAHISHITGRAPGTNP